MLLPTAAPKIAPDKSCCQMLLPNATAKKIQLKLQFEQEQATSACRERVDVHNSKQMLRRKIYAYAATKHAETVSTAGQQFWLGRLR